MIKTTYLFLIMFILNGCCTAGTLNFPPSLDYRSDELNEQLKHVCEFDNCDHIYDYFNKTDNFILKYRFFVKKYENKIVILE